MDREVPFEEDTACDCCGEIGAFDFMGDYLCPGCIRDEESILKVDEEEEAIKDQLRWTGSLK